MCNKYKVVNFKVVDIKRVDFFIPECMEHALASYGETMEIDLLKGFGGAWSFELKEIKASKKVADYLKDKDSLFDRYEKYNGVIIRCIEVSDTKELVKYIENNLKKGIPVLFHMDTYYSNWGLLYNKVHSYHIAVAVGINKNIGKITIVDPDYSDESFEIDLSMLEKSSSFYLDININNIDKFSYEDLLDILCAKKFDYNKQFKQIEIFAEIFAEIFDPNIEFDGNPNIDTVLDSMLISKIRRIIKGRNLFVVFLEQIILTYDKVEKVIELMYISMGKWNTIMNLLFKAARTKWNQELNKKIKMILLSIAEIEKEAYYFLCKCRKMNNKINCSTNIYGEKFFCAEINLKSEFNNKGFVYKDNLEIGCDLTNAGEYVVLNKDLKQTIYNEICFVTYFEKKLDNVVCRGQLIDISQFDNIHSLDFLFCAEWGRCEDSITIYKADGKRFTKKVVANDISEVYAKDTILVGYSKTVDGNIVNEKVVITYNQIINDNDEKIKYFKLPINPNMHLISATALIKEK